MYPRWIQYGHKGILFRVGVGSLLAATERLHNVHKPDEKEVVADGLQDEYKISPPDILDPPLCAPGLLLLLLTSLNLGGLASDLQISTS